MNVISGTLPTVYISYHIPEMILTTDGLTVSQQRKTFTNLYRMKLPYDTILLEHILHGIGTLIYQKHNIYLEHMEIFNKAYTRYEITELESDMELCKLTGLHAT